MSALEHFLKDKQIDPVRLSVVAGVRYLTVWKAMKGQPITAEHAQKLRVALQRMTGMFYIGTIAIIQENKVEELPTLPIRKLPKNR